MTWYWWDGRAESAIDLITVGVIVVVETSTVLKVLKAALVRAVEWYWCLVDDGLVSDGWDGSRRRWWQNSSGDD